MKCVLIVSTSSVRKIFILKRIQGDITINVLTLLPTVEYPWFLSGIQET